MKEKEEVVEDEDDSDESPTREDRKSPARRDDAAEESQIAADKRVPRSPSRSPPGFTRARALEGERDRTPIQRAKPKKDRGRNHYFRGVEFRAKYGFDRGRGGRGGQRW